MNTGIVIGSMVKLFQYLVKEIIACGTKCMMKATIQCLYSMHVCIVYIYVATMMIVTIPTGSC